MERNRITRLTPADNVGLKFWRHGELSNEYSDWSSSVVSTFIRINVIPDSSIDR